MIYLRWVILAVIMLAFTLMAMLLAPVLPAFASADGWLPRWLWWFQTPDNTLDGDGGWVHEHLQWRYKLPEPPRTYVGRAGWLLRNPAYGFGEMLSIPRGSIVTLSGQKPVSGEREPYGWFFLRTTTGWQLYRTWPWGRVNLGWKLWCAPNERASIVCTISR
jgi:hypothetical protein